MTLRSAAAAALLTAVALLASCSSFGDDTSGAATPTISESFTATDRPGPTVPDDWSPAPLSWDSCTPGSGAAAGAECATLEVPLDWGEPDAATIGIALARIPATGDPIGPLLMNPGGPGASGIDFLGYFHPSEEVTERFDLVSWDPRGVGGSEPLDCADPVDEFVVVDPEPDDVAEAAQLDEAAEAISRECGAVEGDLLPHVNTNAVANDVEAIRRALESPQINFVGYSYGSRIGQEYLARYPARVRTMVLDGIVDPAQDVEAFLLDQTTAFDAAFAIAEAACALAGVTQCGVAGLGAAYDEVLAMVEVAPLSTPLGPVTPATLATAAIYTTYSEDGWRMLGPALDAALHGSGTALAELAASYHDGASYPAYAAVVCTDATRPEGAEAYAAFAERASEISPRFGAAVANEMLPCATWPAPSTRSEAAIEVRGGPHVLVIGNTGDAATPIHNAVAVAERIDPSTLITVDAAGHTAYLSNACVDRIVDAYLIDLTVPDGDVDC